jgi:archaellum biogenesis ATPase FlaH
MSDKISIYGTAFQVKVISSLLTDLNFLQTSSDILSGVIFDSDSHAWLCDEVIEYFIKHKTVPTLDVLKIQINEIEDKVLQVAIIDTLRDVWKNIESTDLDFVKEKCLDFCRNQALKNAILESVNLLENQDYDGIKSLIDKSMSVGMERDIGHEYITSLEERLSDSVRMVVPTGWDIIDEVMDGGLGAGELGVIVAPAGIGKTWMLQSIGASGMQRGLTVVHYTLELNQTYVGLRYDTVFSGITTGNIKFYKEDVQKKIDQLKGNLYVKYYPTRSATVQTLNAHLKQLEMQSIKPDMVIVDYADIVKPIGTFREKRHSIGDNYERLRELAGEFEIPVWTASQANRSALEEDVIDASKVSEDYSKVMTSDFVMSISRKVEDKISNTARCHVIKNRFGVDGMTYPMMMNTNIGKIEIYESSTHGGKQQQSKMNNSEEYLRKLAKNKYEDFKIDGTKMEGFE